MYVFFVVQAVLAALHAAVAQAPFFQLACPEAGFIVGSHHIVKCTVRGQNVTGAGCVAPVSSVKLETVNSVVINTIGYSIYPTCETSWSHSGNDKGRCVAIDTNNIYTYEFNVTADRAILTNDTGLRCYADCATGPGLPNPLTYNSSESCGPPVKFVEQTTTVPPSTSESVPPTSSTSPPETMSTSPELSTHSTETPNTKTSSSTPPSSPTAPATTPTPTPTTKSARKSYVFSHAQQALIAGLSFSALAIVLVTIVIVCRKCKKCKENPATCGQNSTNT